MASSSPRGDRYRCIGTSALLGVWVAGAVACKSMTTVQERFSREQQRAEETRAQVKKDAARDVAALEEEERELRRQGKRIELQRKRQELRAEAGEALAAGENARVLEIAREIFDLSETGDFDVDLEEFIKAPEMARAERARVFSLIGSAHYQLGNKDKAITALQKASELDRTLRDARRNLGKILFVEGRYAEAVKAFEKELADGYQDADLLFLLAKARYELAHSSGEAFHKEAARLALERVVVERPGDRDARYWRAMLTYETGRYREAIRLLAELRQSEPLEIEHVTRLADAHRKLDQNEQAIDYLELAAQIYEAKAKPVPKSIALDLSALYADTGNAPGSAAAWLSRAYGDDPTGATNGDRLLAGLLFADAGIYAKATRWLDAVDESSDSEFVDAQARLAVIYEERGDSALAITAYDRVRARRPDDGYAHLAAADIYMDRGRHDEALAAYAKAAALEDTKADGLAGVAEVHYAKGNLDAALKEYERALEVRPDDPRYEAAAREIRAERDQARAEEERTRAGD